MRSPALFTSRNPASNASIQLWNQEIFQAGGLLPQNMNRFSGNFTQTVFDYSSRQFLQFLATPASAIDIPFHASDYLVMQARDDDLRAGSVDAFAAVVPHTLKLSSDFIILEDFVQGAPSSSFAALLSSLVCEILPMTFHEKALTVHTLGRLASERGACKYLFGSITADHALTDAAALARLARIRVERFNERSLDTGRGRASDAGSSGEDHGTSAKRFNAALYPVLQQLEAIKQAPDTEAGQIAVVKLGLRSENMVIWNAMRIGPPQAIAQTYPAMAKLQICALAHSPTVIALELLKHVQDYSSSTLKTLTEVFRASTILPILGGLFPPTATMVVWYGA